MTTSTLKHVLADSYSLYLKTQNYHWHVKGPQFASLHSLFEGHYTELATAIDEIAERIITLGEKAPATLAEISKLSSIKEGDSTLNANDMLKDLIDSHTILLDNLTNALDTAVENSDAGSEGLLSDRIASHQKSLWMLKASLA